MWDTYILRFMGTFFCGEFHTKIMNISLNFMTKYAIKWDYIYNFLIECLHLGVHEMWYYKMEEDLHRNSIYSPHLVHEWGS